MSARASTRRIASAACALCACWLIGCSNDERPPAEPAPVAPPAAKAPAPAPAEPQDPTADELPLQEDFEVEAEQQINDGNFKAELDAIEKEMDAEK